MTPCLSSLENESYPKQDKSGFKSTQVWVWSGWGKVGMRRVVWPCNPISFWMSTFALASVNVFIWGLQSQFLTSFLQSPTSFLVWCFLWTVTHLYLQHCFGHHPLRDATMPHSRQNTEVGNRPGFKSHFWDFLLHDLWQVTGSKSWFTPSWNGVVTKPPIPFLHNFYSSLEILSNPGRKSAPSPPIGSLIS